MIAEVPNGTKVNFVISATGQHRACEQSGRMSIAHRKAVYEHRWHELRRPAIYEPDSLKVYLQLCRDLDIETNEVAR